MYQPVMCRLRHGALELLWRAVEYIGTPVDQDVEFAEGVLDLNHFSRLHLLMLKDILQVSSRAAKRLSADGMLWLGKAAASLACGRKAKHEGVKAQSGQV